jgi:hypothetical protein
MTKKGNIRTKEKGKSAKVNKIKDRPMKKKQRLGLMALKMAIMLQLCILTARFSLFFQGMNKFS